VTHQLEITGVRLDGTLHHETVIQECGRIGVSQEQYRLVWIDVLDGNPIRANFYDVEHPDSRPWRFRS